MPAKNKAPRDQKLPAPTPDKYERWLFSPRTRSLWRDDECQSGNCICQRLLHALRRLDHVADRIVNANKKRGVIRCRTLRSRLRPRPHPARHTTADRMAGHRKSDQRRADPCVGGSSKRAQRLGFMPSNEKTDKPEQGVVANTMNCFRNGDVGFIEWLGATIPE